MQNMQNAKLSAAWQIFDETAGLHPNTVNDGFPTRHQRTGGTIATTQSCPQAIRLMANPQPRLPSFMPSFPPCARRAVDGIFAPGGGRFGTDFQGVLREPAG
jgi:hypothetical protein